MRTRHLRSATILLTLLGGVSLAPAQSVQRPDNPDHSTQESSAKAAPGSPSSGAFENGKLTVPGAAADSDTVPSKFSEKNAADDKRSIIDYTLKHLTNAQKRAIYQSVRGNRQAPALAMIDTRVGDELAGTAELAPLPAELAAQVPETTQYRFAKAGDNVVLVDPANRIVVGVIAPTAQ